MKENENNIADELAELEKIWDRLSPTEKKAVIEFTKSEVTRKQNNSMIIKLASLAGVVYIIIAIIFALLS